MLIEHLQAVVTDSVDQLVEEKLVRDLVVLVFAAAYAASGSAGRADSILANARDFADAYLQEPSK